RAVIHESGAPGHWPLELQPPFEQHTGITDLALGLQLELLFARPVLDVVRVVEQEAASHADCEEGSLVFVPPDELASRLHRLGFAGFDRVVDGRLAGGRCLLLGLLSECGARRPKDDENDNDTRPDCNQLIADRTTHGRSRGFIAATAPLLPTA